MEETRLTKKGDPIEKFVPRLSKEDAAVQGNRWLVLRNKVRLRIIDLLSQYGGLLCVSEIAEVLDESPAVVSRHLSILRAVHLVSAEKFGVYTYYTLRQETINEYKQVLETLQ